MNSLSRTAGVVIEGLVYGFTFAVGWFAALMMLGMVVA